MSSRFPRRHLLFYGGKDLNIIRDIIMFTFNPQDLPHLLGLQHLVDNPILFEYSEKRLSATDLYNRMCSNGEDAVDTDEFEKSIYFDATKIKNFPTKLDKIEYMFWKRYKDKDNNYGYFGIGFLASGKASDINYPNTFFFRLDDEYICNQEVVLPYSLLKKDKNGVRTLEIYWDQVWQGLEKNKHYKKLKKTYLLEDGTLDVALDKIYVPYMKEDFRWTNDEKRFIWQKIIEAGKDLLPNEVIQLLNDYRQKHQ